MIGIYARISRPKEEGKDRSIADQIKLGIVQAEKLNLNYKVYKDEGISGTLPIDKRPDLSRLLDDISSGLITAIYIFDQSRLERNPEVHLFVTRFFRDNNVDVYMESGKVEDTIESELFGGIMSLWNNFTTKMTAKKIKSVQVGLVESGKALASNPYGYKTDEERFLVVDESKRQWVEFIFNESLRGVGTYKIAETLNSKGVLPKPFKSWKTKEINYRWNSNRISYILKNRIYKGERLRNDIVYKIEPIIDEVLWQKVQDNFKNNRTSSRTDTSYDYLLNDIVKCKRCHSNYYGVQNLDNRVNYYQCSSKRRNSKVKNCGSRSINRPALDRIIWEEFFLNGSFEKYIKEYLKARTDSKEVQELKSTLEATELRLKEIDKDLSVVFEALLNGTMSKELLTRNSNKLEREKDKLQTKAIRIKGQLNTLDENLKDIKTFKKVKDNLDFKSKRELIKKYVKQIKISYIKAGATRQDGSIFKGGFVLDIYFELEELRMYALLVSKDYKKTEVVEEYIMPDFESYNKWREEQGMYE